MFIGVISFLLSLLGFILEYFIKVLNNGEEEFICYYCDVIFRIRGYLMRYIKKYVIEKVYYCLFFNSVIFFDFRCYNLGGFSRCDIYKIYLKVRYVLYFKGVKL